MNWLDFSLWAIKLTLIAGACFIALYYLLEILAKVLRRTTGVKMSGWELLGAAFMYGFALVFLLMIGTGLIELALNCFGKTFFSSPFWF